MFHIARHFQKIQYIKIQFLRKIPFEIILALFPYPNTQVNIPFCLIIKIKILNDKNFNKKVVFLR